MKALDVLAAILVIVGGLNWGLFGSLHFDLVASVLGQFSALSRIVYVLVGAAAVYQAVSLKQMQSRWHPATTASGR
jgi:uncharacterized membrane protein YuzA (DUF378 family)